MENVYAFGRKLSPEEHMQSLVDDAHRAFVHGKTGLNNFPTFLLEVLKERAWEHRRSLDRGFVEPMSFRDFIREEYPRGLGSTFEAVEHVVKSGTHDGHREEVLTLWTGLTKRPIGANQHSEGFDNIQDQPRAPTGTSREAGLRRLAKEAEAGNENAAANLREVHEGRKSVNAACVDMGWRPAKIDKDVRDRAAHETAELLAAHVPAAAWDGLKANLYAAGAKHVANALTNITGQSIMDRRGWSA